MSPLWYYRKQLFDSLESRECVIHLLDESSSVIKDEGVVSLKFHDKTSKKQGEDQYSPSFSKNLVSLSKLNSNDYTWRIGDEILKVICSNRIVLQE